MDKKKTQTTAQEIYLESGRNLYKDTMKAAYEAALPVPFSKSFTLRDGQSMLFSAVCRFLERNADVAVNTAWEDIVNWWPLLPEHKEMLLRDNLALYIYVYGAPAPVQMARYLRACPRSDRKRIWEKLVTAFRDFPFTEEVEDETPDGTPSENGMKFCPYCGEPLDDSAGVDEEKEQDNG